MSKIHEVPLLGCTPEPLMSYLKALGILRLVSEQGDHCATGCWRNNQFVLRSRFPESELIRFFLREYRPTPIIVPWSGNDYFAVRRPSSAPLYKKTPTGSGVVEAFLGSSTERFAAYRRAIGDALHALAIAGIKDKSDMEKYKPRYLSALRNYASDDVVGWVDSATIILDKATPFSALLGSGGGSDGNAHFSDNFMQNLWEMLPDFDEQRMSARKKTDTSGGLCRNALFGVYTAGLVPKRTSALYDSGAVGGPNATQGMNRESLSNPWNVILLFEGSMAFAGTLTRRNNSAITVSNDRSAAFPFQFGHTTIDGDNTADTEGTGREIWLPLWRSFAPWDEVSHLLREGRAETGPRPARYSVDMARAAASLGVDRGIPSFYRYAIVRGRVGGENYNTAASLGRFRVTAQREASLFEDFDIWLDRYRLEATKKRKNSFLLPQRFRTSLRQTESAIFDYCRYGRREDMQAALVALGQAEKQLAVTGGHRAKQEICPPLGNLSAQWLKATHDGWPEFAIALSLAAIHDRETRVGPLRTNLEPVAEDKGRWRWKRSAPCVVWSSAELAVNMGAVLQRRIMDGTRAGCANSPLDSKHSVSSDTIAYFIAKWTDDRRIEELLRGLVLIDHKQGVPKGLPRLANVDAPPLPREYALLKLLFLPRPLTRDWDDEKNCWKGWRLARTTKGSDGKSTLENGLAIRPEPRVLPLLRSGRVKDACQIAYRRLRSSGLKPLPAPASSGFRRQSDWEFDPSINPQRLAAALLLPVGDHVVNQLIHLVTRQDNLPDIEIETLITKGANCS